MAVFVTAMLAACAPDPGQQANLPDEAATDQAGVSAFVEGNLYFMAYHELGHAAVSEFGLPIAGREEDAVDRLAIWMMTPESTDEGPDYLMDAMTGWFSLAEQTPLEEIGWWDEHGTSQQRGYQIACLLYGSDADRFGSMADDIELPADRRETCVDEAAANDSAWSVLLAPHLLGEAPDARHGAVEVVYASTSGYAAEQAYLRNIGLLEHLADLMMNDFAFAPGITVAAENCGEPNAYWNADDRRLTICYELVRDFRRLAPEG